MRLQAQTRQKQLAKTDSAMQTIKILQPSYGTLAAKVGWFRSHNFRSLCMTFIPRETPIGFPLLQLVLQWFNKVDLYTINKSIYRAECISRAQHFGELNYFAPNSYHVIKRATGSH